MSDRQLPQWSELKPLLRPRPVELNARKRRLASALTIADLREVARRRTPRSVFDYTDGAAEAELSLQRARATFRDLTFQPSVLRDVGDIDTTTTVLGKPSACWWFSRIATIQRVVASVPFSVATARVPWPFGSRSRVFSRRAW